MKAKKPTPKTDSLHLQRFNDALLKMSQVSVGYQKGTLKHYQYADQVDALISASGWTVEEFQEEIDRRKKLLG